MSKLQRVTTMPRQSLTAMKVAFGVRAQYATILGLTLLMVTQIIGVVIFSGEALALTDGQLATKPATSVTQTDAKLHMQTVDLGNTEAPDYSFEYGLSTSYGSEATIAQTELTNTAETYLTGGDPLYFGYSGHLQKLDAHGNLYVARDCKIRKYNQAGAFQFEINLGCDYYWYNHYAEYNINFAIDSQDSIYASIGTGSVQKYLSDGTASGAPITVAGGVYHLATDAADNLYILRGYSPDSEILRYNSSGVLSAQFAVSFHYFANSLVVDSAGNIYRVIVGSKIQKFNPSGSLLTEWNITGGWPTFIDAQDRIYTPSRVYTTSGDEISDLTTYPPLDGVPVGVNGDAGLLYRLAGTQYSPHVITYARQGEAYVSGLDCETTYHFRAKAQVGGDVVYGDDATFTTGECAAVPAEVQTTNQTGSLSSRILHGTYTPPAGVTERGFEFGATTDYGQQLVNDSETYSHGLSRQWGSFGSGDGQFGSLTYYGVIEADSAGNTYVLDRFNNRVQKFDNQGNYVLQWGDDSGGDYNINGAVDMTINAAGNILVLNSMVREYTPSGVYVSSWNVPYSSSHSATRFDVADDGSIYIIYGESLGYHDFVRKVTSAGIDTGVSWGVGVSDVRDFTVTGDSVYILTGAKQISEFDLNGVVVATHTNFPDQVYGGGSIINVYSMDRITSDEDGYIYASSWLVGRKYDQNFNILAEWPGGDRYGIAVSEESGQIYTLGSSRVNQFAPAITATANSLQCNTQYHYRAYAINDAGISYGQDATFTTESCATITTSFLDDGHENNSYNYQLQTANTHGGNSFSITSGALPTGLSLDSQSGAISGTPEYGTGGSYTFSVTLTDTMGGTTKSVSLYINPRAPLVIATSSLNGGRVGDLYSDELDTYGAIGPVAYEVVSGSLPPGITMDVSGAFSGTPTTSGTYDFRVRATDALDNAEADFTIQIQPALPPSGPRDNTPIVTITSPINNTVFDYLNDDVTVTGTGPAEQTITLYVDSYVLGTTTTDSSGAWSYTANNVFPGTHSFDAKWIPVNDIAFITTISMSDLSTDVRMIDTASHRVIKTIKLPQNSVAFGSVINNAGTKVYFSGFDYATLASTIWEFDVISGTLIRTSTLDDIPLPSSGNSPQSFALALTDDDQYGYVNNITDDGVRVYKIDMTSLDAIGAPIAVPVSSNDGPPLNGYVPMKLAGNQLHLPFSTQDNGTSDDAVINLINQNVSSVTVLNDPRVSYYFRILTVAGGDVYTLVNGKIIRFDPDTNSVISTATIDELSASNRPVALSVDAAHNKAYVSTQGSGIYIVDVASGDATLVTLPGTAPYNSYAQTVQLTSDNTRLYIATVYGSVYILNTETGQIIPESSLLATQFTHQISAQGHFVDQIQAPTASTSFSVGMGPEVIPPPPILPPVDPIEPPENPTITDVTPAPAAPVATPPKSNRVKAPQTVVAAQNNIFALAKRIPEPFAIGFPWLLLLLALILVGMQYYQVHTESKSTKRMQASVAKQERLVEEQNNFVALSTHYLHTPLTVMEGEISLMVKAGTLTQAEATKLKATLTSLNAEAEAALAQEEQSE